VPTDLALATPFQREVLTGLAARVGYGARTTYGELASAVKHPGAARAVGTALGGNPLCIVLPCHRVLPASGGVGGYAGGAAAKEHLLALEAEHVRPPA
jgi:methylated-DNA-[protein]-cysteine S-methyltransferase